MVINHRGITDDYRPQGGLQGSRHEAQHPPDYSPCAWGRLPCLPEVAAFPWGEVRSRLRTGSDKATCDMVVHPGLGVDRPARPILVVADLLGGFKQVASCPLVSVFW